MTVGIIYYSRSGNTRIAVKLLEEKLKQQQLPVQVVEIEAVKNPGYLKAGYSGYRQKELPIKNTEFDVGPFDVLLVGGPIWAGHPSPFIKTFFKHVTNGKGKKVGLFITSGSPPGQNSEAADLMKEYAEQSGFMPIDAFLTLQMMSGEIKDGTQILDHFLQDLIKS